MNEKPPTRAMTSYRTLEAPIHLPEHETAKNPLRSAMISLLSGLVTDFGCAVQASLECLRDSLTIVFTEDEEKRIVHARLRLAIYGDDIERAEKLISQEMTKFGYTNAYRLIEIEKGTEGERTRAVFEIAAARTVETKRGQKRVLSVMPANFLSQVILSWGRFPALGALSKSAQMGVAQKVAEQILSYITLADTDHRTMFPSVSERDPGNRRAAWLGSLGRLLDNHEGFEYARARDLDPTIGENDKNGDRLVNIDPDWVEFVKNPQGGRFPNVFAKNDVVVYERNCENGTGDRRRLYALIPVNQTVIEKHTKLLWWQNRKDEFRPLPAFGDRSWPKADRAAVMVPLEYGSGGGSKARKNPEHQDFLPRLLSDPERSVRWTILSEKRNPAFGHGGHGLRRRNKNRALHDTRWILQFVTAKEVLPVVRDAVLGIHFQDTPVLSWALVREGKIIEEGTVNANPILSHALECKEGLEARQRRQRWVGGRQFSPEIKRRTVELAHMIVAVAVKKEANIVVEDIEYVGKSGTDSKVNSRFSLWNYSDLPEKIRQIALDRHGMTVSSQNEYRAKFACPSCGACRGKGETVENAATWRVKIPEVGNGLDPTKTPVYKLDCRKCGTKVVQDHTYLAGRIALLGYQAAH